MVTAGIKKNEEPSTGMAEVYQVIIGLIEGGKLSVTKDHKQEAALLNRLFTQANKGTASKNLDFKASDAKYNDDSFQQHSNPTSPEGQSQDTHILKKVIQEKFLEFKELIKNESKEEAKLLLKDIIILLNSDTGGQTEFLEMLAPLILGPSLYLLYHRLTDKLDKEYPVWATNREGVDTEKEDSTITVEDFLFQALASVACFRNPDTEDEAGSKPVGEESLKKYAKVSKRSEAMIVGTHRDEVSNDEEFVKHDELLQGKITNTDYEDIVEFASEDHLILDINNFNGGEIDRKHFQDALLRVIDGSFAEVEIPAAWLMLSLYIRIMERRIMPLKELEALSGEIQINPKELQVALWFFHRIMGLFLYYPELEELKDVVICDVRVVFDSITELIRNTFLFKKVGKKAAEKFRNTAQFTKEDLERAIKKSTSEKELISLEKLVKLLEYLNILTTVTPNSEECPSASNVSLSQDVTYFMPSILRSVKASELIVEPSPSDPASLMIRYECGYVPLGVFSCMITNLISQIEKHLIDWYLKDKSVKKNMVKFRDGVGNEITLISRPKYIEVVFSKCSSAPSTLPEPPRVRSVIMSTLETVTSHMNYHFNLKPSFAFRCLEHSGQDNLCKLSVTSEEKYSISCPHGLEKSHPIPLQWKHRVWFDGKSKFLKDFINLFLPLIFLVTLISVTTFLKEEGFKAVDAERLGKCLDGPSSQIEELKRNSHDSKSLLCDIIQCWLDNDFNPSWNSLAVALDKCGYRLMADKIRQPGK